MASVASGHFFTVVSPRNGMIMLRVSRIKTPHRDRNVLRYSEGNPVRSMRWHPSIWTALGNLEVEHHYKVKINRIACVAVEWGLAFLRTLTPELQARILGVKGQLALTMKEREVLQSELDRKLGSMAGKFRFDDHLSFCLPQPVKQLIREEAERSKTTIARSLGTESP